MKQIYKYFFLFINDKMEFISSSEGRCPKSGVCRAKQFRAVSVRCIW